MAPRGRNVPTRPRISLPLLRAVSAMGDAGAWGVLVPVTGHCRMPGQQDRLLGGVLATGLGCGGGAGLPREPRGIVAAGREGLVWMAGSFIWPQRAV